MTTVAGSAEPKFDSTLAAARYLVVVINLRVTPAQVMVALLRQQQPDALRLGERVLGLSGRRLTPPVYPG